MSNSTPEETEKRRQKYPVGARVEYLGIEMTVVANYGSCPLLYLQWINAAGSICSVAPAGDMDLLVTHNPTQPRPNYQPLHTRRTFQSEKDRIRRAYTDLDIHSSLRLDRDLDCAKTLADLDDIENNLDSSEAIADDLRQDADDEIDSYGDQFEDVY